MKFGPGQTNPDYWTDPDSYAMPLVAACCGPFDYESPTSEEKAPYVNNCLYDAVQQICIGLPHLLRKQAEETALGDGKLALELLAGRIEKNASECRSGLWKGGPPGPDGQAPNQLAGTTWTPPKTSATIRIVNSEIYDWTTVGDVPELTPCFGVYDNDPAVVPTAPFDVPGVVLSLAENSSGTVSGPWASEGQFTIAKKSSSATFGHDELGATLVSGLRLDAGPTFVSVAGGAVMISHARLLLATILRPAMEGDGYVVSAGEAKFTAMLGAPGGSRILSMRNADPIVFRFDEGVWAFDPFDLVYEEVGIGDWILAVDGLDFAESPDL